jgi:hypothetical protein
MSANEFEGIFISPTGNRPLMSKPKPFQATKRFIHEVQDALGIPDEKAPEAADWVANKMERFGASMAQPVFTMDGSGPSCSWCGMIWPLCGHHHMSNNLPADDEEDATS